MKTSLAMAFASLLWSSTVMAVPAPKPPKWKISPICALYHDILRELSITVNTNKARSLSQSSVLHYFNVRNAEMDRARYQLSQLYGINLSDRIERKNISYMVFLVSSSFSIDKQWIASPQKEIEISTEAHDICAEYGQ